MGMHSKFRPAAVIRILEARYGTGYQIVRNPVETDSLIGMDHPENFRTRPEPHEVIGYDRVFAPSRLAKTHLDRPLHIRRLVRPAG